MFCGVRKASVDKRLRALGVRKLVGHVQSEKESEFQEFQKGSVAGFKIQGLRLPGFSVLGPKRAKKGLQSGRVSGLLCLWAFR